MFDLAIIIPVLNEAETIEKTLRCLDQDTAQQVIVVDGGSEDETVAIVQQQLPTCDIIFSKPGRAIQMNTGAAHANAKTLLFLHADTFLPKDYAQQISAAISTMQCCWGRFDVELSSTRMWARCISWLINWRSRTFGVATGDQAIFIKRDVFNSLDGFPKQPLMEDVEISKRLLKQFGKPACLLSKVVTSSRRWENHGVLKTVLLMWQLRLYYYFGVSADRLYKKYY